MSPPDAPRPPAAEGADAEYMAFHRLVGYVRHAEGCAYSDVSDAACSCGLWEAHDTLGNLLATRPAPSITAAERAALDRLDAWWQQIEGATSLPYHEWRYDVYAALTLARRAGAAATPREEMSFAEREAMVDSVIGSQALSGIHVERLAAERLLDSVMAEPLLDLEAATPRAGGATYEDAVAVVQAFHDEWKDDLAYGHNIDVSIIREVLVRLEDARPTTPPDHAGGGSR
jgi:hypothetical protein